MNTAPATTPSNRMKSADDFDITIREAIARTPLAKLPAVRQRSITVKATAAMRDAYFNIATDLPAELLAGELQVTETAKYRRYRMTDEGARLLGEWATNRWIAEVMPARDTQESAPLESAPSEPTLPEVAAQSDTVNSDESPTRHDALADHLIDYCFDHEIDVPWRRDNPLEIDSLAMLRVLLENVNTNE